MTHPTDQHSLDSNRPITVGSPLLVLRHLAANAHRQLLMVGAVIFALAPICTAISLLDSRVLDGANVWFKPIKFQLSVSIFLVTLSVMVAATGPRFKRSIIGRSTIWIAISTSVFEIFWITVRAALAERSHYDTDTAFGSTMYALMGVAAVLLSATPIVIAIAALASRSNTAIPKLLPLGMLLGSLVAFVGAAVVGSMLSRSPEHYPTSVADQSSRLPFIGWSVERDDLRIAHFVGLHALQGLIALAVILLPSPRRLAGAILCSTALTWLAAVLGLVLLAVSGGSPLAWIAD